MSSYRDGPPEVDWAGTIKAICSWFMGVFAIAVVVALLMELLLFEVPIWPGSGRAMFMLAVFALIGAYGLYEKIADRYSVTDLESVSELFMNRVMFMGIAGTALGVGFHHWYFEPL